MPAGVRHIPEAQNDFGFTRSVVFPSGDIDVTERRLGILFGATFGAVVGVLVGLETDLFCGAGPCGFGAFGGALLGGAIGAIVGGLIGATVADDGPDATESPPAA